MRSIGSDLKMDYTAVGQTTHLLAARMEQMAMLPGSIMMSADARFGKVHAGKATWSLNVITNEPIEVPRLPAGPVRSQLQAAARGLTRSSGAALNSETLCPEHWIETKKPADWQRLSEGQGRKVAPVLGIYISRHVDWLIARPVQSLTGRPRLYLPLINL